MKRLLQHLKPILYTWPLAVSTLTADRPPETQVHDLDAFIVEQSAMLQPESLSPLSARVTTLFGENLDVMGSPRAVSIITPEIQALLGIEDYDTLPRFGAGTQRKNYFGLAGSAFLRGARAGTYFNGMLRAYQRNQMPMSFGSLEGLQMIKGPAPANLSPTLVGGFVVQQPKQPFYDRARSEIQLQVGSENHRRLQWDAGAPFLLGEKPAAFRVSTTFNRADRYYDRIQHDFESFYGAMKVRLSNQLEIFFGGEYYNFRSSEIPGYNRPTQDLIDNRNYIIGEAPDIRSSQWGGNTVRSLLEYPYTIVVDPGLQALAIPGDIARERIPENLRGEMIYLGDEAGRSQVYRLRPADQIPGFVYGNDPDRLNTLMSNAQAALDQIDPGLQDAYLYTPDYFAAGGNVLTDTISRRNILADERDRVDSEDFILFADLDGRIDSERSWRLRFFSEGLKTEKSSTYGFAMNTRQFLANTSLEWHQRLPDHSTSFTAGIDLRGSYAKMLQDFDAEPFSRRDLTKPITGNSVVLTGPQRGPDGLNYWSTFGTASQVSQLYQTAVFLSARSELRSNFELFYGLRAEQARYRGKLPSELDRAIAEQREERRQSGKEFLYQFSLNPIWKLHAQFHIYGALQYGKAVSPGDGGTIAGPSTFTDVELYEVGFKTRSEDEQFFLSLALYHWDQANFSSRDASARPIYARGLEIESSYSPREWLSFLFAFTAQRVILKTDTLGFGAVFLTEEEWALRGGILNGADNRDISARNPERVMAGLPELSSHLYTVIDLPAGWSFGGGPLWCDAHWNDMGRNLRIPSSIVWNAHLGWENNRFSLRLRVDNLFDTETMVALEPIFAANTLILPGEGRSWRLSANYRF